MFSTIVLIVLLLTLIGTAIWWLKFPVQARNDRTGEIKSYKNPIALMSFGGVMLIFLMVLGLSCLYIVDTRQVGIVTKFNRPTGQTLNNGLHPILPWEAVHEMDAAIQNSVYRGNDRILVRLGNNSTAQADANIRWQIRESAADELFVQYKDFEGVKSNLVDRNLRVALNESFASYDPLAKKNLEESPLPEIASNATHILQNKVGDQVEIIDVSVPTIDFDDDTEKKINQINEERANTTRAEQEVKTNVAKREAAEKLADMPPPDLRIAMANCLNKMAQTGQNLNCWPIGQGVVPTLQVPTPLPTTGH